MAFDYLGAKAAGYSDADIQAHLSQTNQGFDVQGALKAGYTPQDIQGHLNGNSQPSQPAQASMGQQIAQTLLPANTQAVSNALNIGQADTQYQQDTAGQNPLQRLLNPETYTHALGNTVNLVKSVFDPHVLEEDASLALPVGKGVQLDDKLGRAAVPRVALGAGQGLLSGLSNPNNTPGSIGASTAMGALLPSFLENSAKTLGKIAFGQGGEKLPQIIQEAGSSIGSTDIEPLQQILKPVSDKINTLEAAGKPLSKSAIVGKVSYPAGLPVQNGIFQKVSSNLGDQAREIATPYLQRKQAQLEGLWTDSLVNSGVTPKQAALTVNNPDAEVPVPVLASFLDNVYKDVNEKTWTQGAKVPTNQSEIAQKLSGELRKQIATQTGNPDEYDRLKGLLSTPYQISNNKDIYAVTPKGIISNIYRKLELPGVGAAVSLGLHGLGPAGLTTGAILGAIPTIPGVAKGYINTATNPALQKLLQLGGERMSQNATNYLQQPQTQ